MHKVRVGIIGASGYTGLEAIKVLLSHRYVEITSLTALPEDTGPIGKIFPALRGKLNIDIEPFDIDKFTKKVDIALCCLPHKVSMSYVPSLLESGLKVIDFSADYRLKDISIYEKFYTTHTDKENLKKAVYGLPEIYKDLISKTSLVANPGCFPTSIILGLAPLLKEGLVDTNETIIASSITGVSGAGRRPSLQYHFPEMNENIFPYAIGGSHRHSPEIEQVISDIAGKNISFLFQPHVASIDRGILSTIYTTPKEDIRQEKLFELYKSFYNKAPFVRILEEAPKLKAVANTNFCDIHPVVCHCGRKIIVFSAIDNLIKGASGQAVQNLNIMCGFDEKEGLL